MTIRICMIIAAVKNKYGYKYIPFVSEPTFRGTNDYWGSLQWYPEPTTVWCVNLRESSVVSAKTCLQTLALLPLKKWIPFPS